MRWAISIAGLVMTSYVQAAEISFEVDLINGMGEKSDIALLHPVNKSRADIFRTGLDIVDVLTNLPSITTETHPDKDTDPVVSTGPLTMRPLAGTEPADQHFLGYLSLIFIAVIFMILWPIGQPLPRKRASRILSQSMMILRIALFWKVVMSPITGQSRDNLAGLLVCIWQPLIIMS